MAGFLSFISINLFLYHAIGIISFLARELSNKNVISPENPTLGETEPIETEYYG